MAGYPPQMIAYMNVVPKETKAGTRLEYPEFESMSETCNTFNKWLAENPLPGKTDNIRDATPTPCNIFSLLKAEGGGYGTLCCIPKTIHM